MKKETNWFGVDMSNKESLFEYGFLMRYNPKGNTMMLST